MSEIDFNKYKEFVHTVTSPESKDQRILINRLNELNKGNINVPLLLTSAIGMGAESGEFQEIIKKIVFQGKPLNDDNLFHMKRELGDIIWYWVNACNALGLDINEVVGENVKKLEARYPGGKFDVYQSENRKENDL